MEYNIWLIGCGKMGSALAEGWLNDNSLTKITIIDPFIKEINPKISSNKKVKFFENIKFLNVLENPSMIVLAVKPQLMKDVLIELNEKRICNTCWLTIAAGLTIKFYENILGDDASIIRTIPNTPASISKGITAICYNKNTMEDKKLLANKLMKSVGQIISLEDETLMNSITAVSGSGPAYIFLMVEALINAAISVGLNKEVAVQLAKATLIGSALLLEESEEDASSLRKAVTSPKGTTEAGLSVLLDENIFFNLMKNAVKEARKRGDDLGRLNV